MGALCLASAACQSTETPPPQSEVLSADRASADAIGVSQRDFAYGLERASAKPGWVEFRIKNEGSEHHEFVVVGVDGDRWAPPSGEHEAIEPGDSGLLRVWLKPGQYRLVCLLITIRPDGPVSHVELGMDAPFEVAS